MNLKEEMVLKDFMSQLKIVPNVDCKIIKRPLSRGSFKKTNV